MFYKPTYCSSCGDKIERIEWRLLTSRRFCEVCEIEYKFDDWLPRIAGALSVLIGVWGFGFYFSSSAESIEISNTKTLTSSRIANTNGNSSRVRLEDTKTRNARKKEKLNAESVKEREGIRRSEIKTPLVSETISQPPAKRIDEERKTIEVSESIYYCGAETKKGTPCSRKVKGKKRCWQHKGRDAMLPQSKLAVGDSR